MNLGYFYKRMQPKNKKRREKLIAELFMVGFEKSDLPRAYAAANVSGLLPINAAYDFFTYDGYTFRIDKNFVTAIDSSLKWNLKFATAKRLLTYIEQQNQFMRLMVSPEISPSATQLAFENAAMEATLKVLANG